jgi:hypothetical protein
MRKLRNALDQASDSIEAALAALDEQITDQENEFVGEHSEIVRLLCTLPADELLGLSLGVLSGASLRQDSQCAREHAHMSYGVQDSDSGLLQAWLLRALSSSDDQERVIRGLAAFRIGNYCSQRLAEHPRDGARDSVAVDVLTSVTNTISEAMEHAWCLRQREDLRDPPQVEELRASLLDNEALRGFEELTAGQAGIKRLECIGELTRRRPPYALVTVHRLIDLRDGTVDELGDQTDNPTVVMLREDLVQGLGTVRQGERIRLELESGLAGRVLAS